MSTQDSTTTESPLEQELRVMAFETQSEAWTEGRLAGVETRVLAEAAIATALRVVHDEGGEEAAEDLLNEMRERLVAGEFGPQIVRH